MARLGDCNKTHEDHVCATRLRSRWLFRSLGGWLTLLIRLVISAQSDFVLWHSAWMRCNHSCNFMSTAALVCSLTSYVWYSWPAAQLHLQNNHSHLKHNVTICNTCQAVTGVLSYGSCICNLARIVANFHDGVCVTLPAQSYFIGFASFI